MGSRKQSDHIDARPSPNHMELFIGILMMHGQASLFLQLIIMADGNPYSTEWNISIKT